MGAKRPTDWGAAVARFDKGKAPRRTFRLSSPGVAQVTRVRLLADYPKRGVRIRTKGAALIFEKPAHVQPSR